MEAAKAANAKKAKDTVILEVKGLTFIADYFIICSGESTTHVRAIAENIEAEFRRKTIKPLSVEGLSSASWVLMDYSDVIVHIFQDDARDYYKLEKLWLDAPRITPKE